MKPDSSKRFGLCFILICAAVVLLAGFNAFAGDTPVIQVRTHATVSDDTIFLGNIAEVQSADSHMKDRLEQVVIGRSPLPGQSRYIQPNSIEARLRQAELDADQVHIRCNGPVKITRVYNELSSKQIRSAVRQFIQAHAPWGEKQLNIRSIYCNQDLRLPPGRISLNVSAPKHTDWMGAVPFLVHVAVNGQTVKKISVPANIEVWSQVVVAAKPLGRNEPVSRSDIRTERMNLARVPADAVLNAEQVLGRRTNRAIAANSIMRNDQVELPPAVRRGDVIQMLAESGNLKISTRGIAKEDGRPGERIRVSNLRSHKIVYGQVIDARTARVEF